ncbi:MAG: ABC transporter ATP-binding protein [Clostridiales bacterium]|nr:ABC transporter ATP-binding protein [Clostridiales bacterium]
MNSILQIKNLTKYYGKTLGVKDINLELDKGEIFGFIGPNGAGKSTTIRSVLNLINKTSGEVLFEGKTLDKNDTDAKSQIGYLPSEINLYDDLTVKQMLDLHEKFFDKDISQRRKELTDRLKLDETKKTEELSLGNLKKLGIVLAFMHEPKLLILDEPTSGLDPIIQQEFFNLLTEEKQKGTTVFYSTHILSEISKICDRVGIIKSGRLLKVEPVKELIDKSLSYVTVSSKHCDEIIKDLNIEPTAAENNTVIFKNTSDADTLVKTLAKYRIDKLYIEQASLEDIFLHYYEQEG